MDFNLTQASTSPKGSGTPWAFAWRVGLFLRSGFVRTGACAPRTPGEAPRRRVRPWARRQLGRWLALVGACAALAAGAQQPAHQHGAARLDAALDGPLLTLALNTPLDSLLGFERAPRGAAEQRAARELVERLRSDASLLRPDPAAGCVRSGVELESAALSLGQARPDADGHAELDATWTFRCEAPQKLAFIDLGLVAAWPRIGRIDAQIASVRGQSLQVLRPPARRLAWPR